MDPGAGTEIIYNDLFGKDSSRVIYCEGLPISKHLSVSENGFFPGINYITLSESDNGSVKGLSEVVVQMDSTPGNNFSVAFDPGTAVGDVLMKIAKIKEIDGIACLHVVFNGLLLSPEMMLGDFVKNGDVIDVVQASFG